MKFLRVTLFTCLSMALLCIGVSLLGQRSPTPEIIPGLTLCNELPCYMGITINTTTWEEGQQLLESLPNFKVDAYAKWAEVTNSPVRNLQMSSDDQSIIEIDLIFREGTLPFFKVIATLGMPCGVQPLIDPNYLAISFHNSVVYVQVDRFNILPKSSVLAMFLGSTKSPKFLTTEQQNQQCLWLTDGTNRPRFSWQGYGSRR